MGFLSSLGVILWLPVVTMGTMVSTVYAAYLGYGWLGFALFVGGNTGIAVYWNKARKSQRMDAFDDRLSFERMDQARDWWVSLNASDDESKEDQ